MSSSRPDRQNEICFFFHGFPGLKSLEMLTPLAKRLAHERGVDTHVMAYPGLHDDLGAFSFAGAIQASREMVARKVSEKDYDRVHFIGHSWGGFVSLALSKSMMSSKLRLVLLAPLTRVGGRDRPERLFGSVAEIYPEKFKPETREAFARDMLGVCDAYDFNRHAAGWLKSESVKIILAKHDDAVTRAESDAFLLQYGRSPLPVEVLDDDHGFTLGPEQLFRAVSRSIGESDRL
jgi:esterase/lipase